VPEALVIGLLLRTAAQPYIKIIIKKMNEYYEAPDIWSAAVRMRVNASLHAQLTSLT